MKTLDAYCWHRAVLQADDVTAYAKRNREWAAIARPEMLERNATYFLALKSVARAIRTPNLDAYILRPRQREMQGLLTIGHSQTISALGRRVVANQIDISFDEDVRIADQRSIVTQAVALAGAGGRPVFAALTEAEKERAEGVGLILPPVGPMGYIPMPEGDPFGVNDKGPVQLYFDPRSVA